MGRPREITVIATSYPRSQEDWQGLFIRKIVEALSRQADTRVSLWAPEGPLPSGVDYLCSTSDARWLAELARAGGIAHRLRSSPVSGLGQGLSLLRRLRGLYKERASCTDVFHINWLQNALPLKGLGAAAVVTVLGSDYQLLSLPGMVKMLRGVFKSNRCVLAPNAQWMVSGLQQHFGDVAPIRRVNFGIDDPWFALERQSTDGPAQWICVTRLTEGKLGTLFDWGKSCFDSQTQLHLIGPNQSGVIVPDWVYYHDAMPAQRLLQEVFPSASGFITLSQHAEGKPQVLLETLAAGLPVVASDIPAHREVISHGRQGYLVDSEESLYQAITALQDPEHYQQISTCCRRTASQEYGSWDDCARRYSDLYQELS